jgi:hypothetical protein
MTDLSLATVLPALALNVVALILIAYVFYFRRYHRRDMTVAIAAINISLFALGGALGSFTLSLGVGFALFAVISIIRLRSDEAGWFEMAYLLVALSVGLILGLPAYSLSTQAMYAGFLVIAIYLIDNPRLFHNRNAFRMTVTFDFVETNPDALIERASQVLGLSVKEVNIRAVVINPPSMKADVRYTVH